MATKKTPNTPPIDVGDISEDPPAAQEDLAAQLTRKVVDRLLALEKEGRDDVRDQYYRAGLSPLSSDAMEKWQEGSERVAETAELLREADRFPWIHPFFAAVAFESMYSGCVYVWLSAGKPESANEIAPSVDDYIKWQIETFVTAIGANRRMGGKKAGNKKVSKKATKKVNKTGKKKTTKKRAKAKKKKT